MNIEKAVYHTALTGEQYSDMSAKRRQKQIDKAALKGEKERAKLGLTNLPTPSAAEEPAASGTGNKTLIYAGAGAAILVVILIVFLKR
ncbi:MAG: hypothetical protein NTX61_08245 [Bacteroidetes bacterium]|nr:hypothetical protein [Bacteroidota bacterium]